MCSGVGCDGRIGFLSLEVTDPAELNKGGGGYGVAENPELCVAYSM